MNTQAVNVIAVRSFFICTVQRMKLIHLIVIKEKVSTDSDVKDHKENSNKEMKNSIQSIRIRRAVLMS